MSIRRSPSNYHICWAYQVNAATDRSKSVSPLYSLQVFLELCLHGAMSFMLSLPLDPHSWQYLSTLINNATKIAIVLRLYGLCPV
jgi:hypothetical protein